MAERTLDRRAALVNKRKAAHEAGKRDVVKAYDAEIDSLMDEAREFVAEAERSEAIRGAHTRAGALGDASRNPERSEDPAEEWRTVLPSREEYRAILEGSDADGGYLVPHAVNAQILDMLRNKAVFLRGLPAESIMPFKGKSWSLPTLEDSDEPTLTNEGATIDEGDDEFGEIQFTSKKYADIRRASSEVLADSEVDLRRWVGANMVRNLAAKMDRDAFQGSASVIEGLIPKGTSTEVAATHDAIADAVGRLWGANAEPTVIWAATDAATALLKEREGTEGGYLNDTDNPVTVAKRLPILPSNSLPAGHVVVADGSRVLVGLAATRVAVSEHESFSSDKTTFRLTRRAAGIYVAEATSVQVLTPPA